MEISVNEIRELFAASRFRPDSYVLNTLDPSCPAWVVRFAEKEAGISPYGIAIPYDGKPINEKFNEIQFRSDELYIDKQLRKVLILVCDDERRRNKFAFLCGSLADPGKNGERRHYIQENPVEWWKEWKELVGNSAVNEKPHAVIGELLIFRHALEKDPEAKWSGPDSSSIDIQTKTAEYEVKSTLKRYMSTVRIPGQFQLAGNGKNLYLAFNRFEKRKRGISINSLVADITERFGYPEEDLEKALKKLGYPKGRSSRDETYAQIECKFYRVDENFPKITEIPPEIQQVEYTLDLRGCKNYLVSDGLDQEIWP